MSVVAWMEKKKAFGFLSSFVLSVLCFVPLSFAEGLRDIRGPVSLQSDWWWVGLLLGVLLGAGLIGGALIFLHRARCSPVLLPPRPAWEIAWEALDRLEKGELISKGRIKEYYAELSDILRRYIEGRFGIRAPEMTTQEFMDKARGAAELSDAQKAFLQAFLDDSDMVKFAKFLPSADRMKESLHLARRFVEETRSSGDKG